MFSLFAAVLSFFSPAVGSLFKNWADGKDNARAEANRPDIIAAKRAQVAQADRDTTNAEIAGAEDAKAKPAASQAALDKLREDASA